MFSLTRSGVVGLLALVLLLFLFCVWTSSLLHIHLLFDSSRSVDRPCYELDRQSLHSRREESNWFEISDKSAYSMVEQDADNEDAAFKNN